MLLHCNRIALSDTLGTLIANLHLKIFLGWQRITVVYTLLWSATGTIVCNMTAGL